MVKGKTECVLFGQAHSVAWNCDGRRLASGSMDNTVAVFACDRDSCAVVSNDIELLLQTFIHRCSVVL